jgi:hypothetical protein
MEVIENKVSVFIEDLEYWVYESYILRGSGYTFGFYWGKDLCERCDNVYNLDFDFNKYVIFGDKYNWILNRKKTERSIKFEPPIKYEKDYLKIVKSDKYDNYFNIELNGVLLESYSPGDSSLEERELDKQLVLERKKKLNNICLTGYVKNGKS